MEKKILKDLNGRYYEVPNFNSFMDHITTYHTQNGQGDGSIHEEKGYYFKITAEYYQQLLEKS